jgi:hypothetical protein
VSHFPVTAEEQPGEDPSVRGGSFVVCRGAAVEVVGG